MLEQKRRNDCDSDSTISALHDSLDVFIGQSNNVLSIDLHKLMIDQHSIASCRAVLHYRGDFTILECESRLNNRFLINN
jgi:hypothetical protein